MRIVRVATALLLSTVVLAGCGGDESVAAAKVKLDPKGFAQASTTLPPAAAGTPETGGAAPADAPRVLDPAIPADDGGALCEALEAFGTQIDEATGDDPTASQAGAIYESGAATFGSTVLPKVPTALRDGAEAYQAELLAAGQELSAFPDGAASVADLYDAGEIPVFGRLVQPTSVARATDEVDAEIVAVYESAFHAWMASPCGPKSLEIEDARFEPIGDSI